jgi:hypothetical protein
MPRRIMLPVFALTFTAMTADAADLPTQSRLGAMFAEPGEVRLVRTPPREPSELVVGFNLMPVLPWNRGGFYYGSPWSYYYGGPYYGGPSSGGAYSSSATRLPYVCGLYGYCF